jgi:hypothetical protein
VPSCAPTAAAGPPLLMVGGLCNCAALTFVHGEENRRLAEQVCATLLHRFNQVAQVSLFRPAAFHVLFRRFVPVPAPQSIWKRRNSGKRELRYKRVTTAGTPPLSVG